MKLLLTGASGFVGSHIVRVFAAHGVHAAIAFDLDPELVLTGPPPRPPAMPVPFDTRLEASWVAT